MCFCVSDHISYKNNDFHQQKNIIFEVELNIALCEILKNKVYKIVYKKYQKWLEDKKKENNIQVHAYNKIKFSTEHRTSIFNSLEMKSKKSPLIIS